MKRRVFAILLFLSICFFRTVFIAHEARANQDKIKRPVETIQLHPRMKHIKIAVLQFLPLPTVHLKHRHERVFTGEIYSASDVKSLKQFDGYFIPREYLNIFNSMLETTAWMYRIDLSVVSDLRELCFKKPDIIAFGAVVEAKVKKSSGHLCVHVYLIDGKTLKPIDKQFIRKDVDKKRTPFSLQTPIHTRLKGQLKV